MFSVVAVRIPNAIASNKSPTMRGIKKIEFLKFCCLYINIFSEKHLLKKKEKREVTNQSD